MMKNDDLQAAMSKPIGKDVDVDPSSANVQPTVKASETALVMDRYTRSVGRELVSSIDDKVVDETFGTDDPAAVAADMVNATFEPCPKLADDCVSEERREYMAELLQSHEYQKLHRSTKLNRIASEVAAMQLGQQYLAYQSGEQQPDDPDNPDGSDGPASHVQEGIDKAKEEADTVNETMAAMGVEGASCNNGIQYENMKGMFHKMQESRMVRVVMKLAGRWRRMAQSCQGTKYIDGMDEVVGTEFGKDVPRMLSSELIYLADPELEDLFWQRYANQGLRLRVTADTTQEMQGPVVVAVDESGSMDWGGHIHDAKAMALAMLWIARSQRRPCILVGFSGEGERGNWYVEHPGEQPDTNALMEWIEHFYCGGTAADVIVNRIPNRIMGDPAFGGRTDILCITDGVIATPNQSELEDFRTFKRSQGVKLKTISLGEDIGTLADDSDDHYLIDKLDIHDDSTQAAFSI